MRNIYTHLINLIPFFSNKKIALGPAQFWTRTWIFDEAAVLSRHVALMVMPESGLGRVLVIVVAIDNNGKNPLVNSAPDTEAVACV